MSSGVKSRGFAGWIALPIIGFFGVIVMTALNLIATLQMYEGLQAIFSASDPRLTALILPTVLSLVFGIAIIASGSICLYRIFVVGHGLVKFTTIHYAILICGALVDVWTIYLINAAFPSEASYEIPSVTAAKTVFYSVLWGSYFLLSKRVKETYETINVGVLSTTGVIDAPR